MSTYRTPTPPKSKRKSLSEYVEKHEAEGIILVLFLGCVYLCSIVFTRWVLMWGSVFPDVTWVTSFAFATIAWVGLIILTMCAGLLASEVMPLLNAIRDWWKQEKL